MVGDSERVSSLTWPIVFK